MAALYVHPKGCYAGLPDVDPWPEARDARLYSGPWPVVAHPPCGRWCQLAAMNEARYGLKIGDDGGRFEAALASVRRHGGVLEHPAYSLAFDAFGLPIPPWAGWQRSICGGWSAHVEQGFYGHPAKKGTWLYVYGCDPPPLKWGRIRGRRALISYCQNHLRDGGRDRIRLTKKQASATPPAFRDLLLSIARSAA